MRILAAGFINLKPVGAYREKYTLVALSLTNTKTY